MTRLTDSDGNQTDLAYDRIGRKISETDPKGKTLAYSYDAASNLTAITDRLGRKREFVYDAADRLTTEQWKTGTTTLRAINFGYNDADQLITVSDPDSSYTFNYDAAGRLATVENRINGSGTPLVPDVLL